MKVSAGSNKVLMLAFGHPENVLSLCKAVSSTVPIELVFVVAKERFRQGIMDIDISQMPYGLNSYNESKEFLPIEVRNFVGGAFRVRFIRSPSRSLFRNRGLQNFRIICRAARQLRAENYRTVHYNGSSGFMALYRLILKGKKKTIWTVHDYVPHTGEGNKKFLFIRRLVMLMKFEYIQHYSWLRDRFIEYFNTNPGKVHHVYSGPFDIFKQFEPIEVPVGNDYILFFGRISPYKGIDVLVKAFLRFKEQHPELTIKLCIAGDGELWFDEQVMDRSDIIFINRYVKTGELVHLIQNCRFVVLPYTDSTHSAVVMTSYVFNKPVIGSDVGGLHEVILNNETGCLVIPNDIDAMANAIYGLISDKQRLQKFENNIRQFINKGPIRWDRIAEKMKSIYLR